jgi:hypothetical protein
MMARTEEQIAELSKVRYEAELAILQNIADDKVNAGAMREYAEAYALLTGKLSTKSN